MPIGIITGTGTYSLPEFQDAEAVEVETRWGVATVTRGRFAEIDVLHVSRHGSGHARLSSHVDHRANIAALRELGARAAIGCTACGIVEPAIAPGSLIVFDDLHFPVNRLPDGSLCTLYDTPGEPGRGHWIYDRPFSPAVRSALLEGAEQAGPGARDGGCYGHVDGPRFNTATEIRQLAAAGVTAVSQTAGPETVLCGEAEIPYALIGFTTDYANDVAEHTPIDELVRLMAASTGTFASVLAASLPRIDLDALVPTGVQFRFD
jgi:purine nucleoside phosphorylase